MQVRASAWQGAIHCSATKNTNIFNGLEIFRNGAADALEFHEKLLEKLKPIKYYFGLAYK